MQFPLLFSPFTLKTTEFRNRIFSTGHDTYLPEDGLPSDALIAYQRARARGGAGLIVIQVVGVHETSRYTEALLMGTSDDCIPHFKRLVDAIHAEGTKVFIQLFHPGRELLGRPDGVIQPAFAPSHSPSERFQVIPREMSPGLIGEIVDGFGQAARRMAEAGADGVEIVASHGYLPAQFMNPNVNRRSDRYGGSLENRLRFTREAIAAIRANVPSHLIVGMRMSGDEHDEDGLTEDDSLAIARALKDELDYLNVIAGTSATASGATHIVPSMANAHGYVAPFARKVKQATGATVFVAGRINQPQIAESVLATAAADMCGMTRAMICDPEMPNKARRGAADDIRACIGCNQACIGHFQLGLPISCIQHPETGRELLFERKSRAARARRIMVVGGGPAGLKAAAVAAERGHQVTLHERDGVFGGQARLAQLLPNRAEFGGIVNNLSREAERQGAVLRTRSEVTATCWRRKARCGDPCHRQQAASAAHRGRGRAAPAIHRCDRRHGTHRRARRDLRLAWRLDRCRPGREAGQRGRAGAGWPSTPCALPRTSRPISASRSWPGSIGWGWRCFPGCASMAADGRTAYFVHTASREAVVLEDVDTLVLSTPNHPCDELVQSLTQLGIEHHLIGDCLTPRTAEEAVYEGLKAGLAV